MRKSISKTVLFGSAWILSLVCILLVQTGYSQDTIIDPYRITKPYQKQELNPWDSMAAYAYQMHLKKIDSLQWLLIRERLETAKTDTSIKSILIDKSQIQNASFDFSSLIQIETLIVNRCPKLDLDVLLNQVIILKNLKYLEISQSKCKKLPESINRISSLQGLQLKDNNFTDLPSLQGLKNLSFLGLSINPYLSEAIIISKAEELESLKSLDISYCQIINIPSEISKLNQVESLNIGANAFTVLPVSMTEMKNLTTINLHDNKLLNQEAIFEVLKNLKGLKALDLSNCRIRELNKNICLLTSLEWLDLRGNDLSELPANLGKLDQLTYLNFSAIGMPGRDRITRFPPSFKELASLEYLDASGHFIEKAEGFFKKMKTLKHLNLSVNKLEKFPADISEAKSLTYANFGLNAFVVIPESIKELQMLDTLILDGNFFLPATAKMKKLPESIVELKGLKYLSVNDQVLENIPEKISALKDLQYLSLRDNLLKVLPNTITSLKKLQYLNVKANELISLPKNLNKLEALVDLNISFNPALDFNKEIPNIASVKSLKKLDISYNKVQSLKSEQLKSYLPDCEIKNINLKESKKK